MLTDLEFVCTNCHSCESNYFPVPLGKNSMESIQKNSLTFFPRIWEKGAMQHWKNEHTEKGTPKFTLQNFVTLSKNESLKQAMLATETIHILSPNSSWRHMTPGWKKCKSHASYPLHFTSIRDSRKDLIQISPQIRDSDNPLISCLETFSHF